MIYFRQLMLILLGTPQDGHSALFLLCSGVLSPPGLHKYAKMDSIKMPGFPVFPALPDFPRKLVLALAWLEMERWYSKMVL